jgi:hypothetical protein
MVQFPMFNPDFFADSTGAGPSARAGIRTPLALIGQRASQFIKSTRGTRYNPLPADDGSGLAEFLTLDAHLMIDTKNPSEIAREASNLTVRKLLPTPANYRACYNEVAASR